MSTTNRKPTTQRTSSSQPAHPLRDARSVDRAVCQDHTPTGEQSLEGVIVDHDFHAPVEDIEIDPQLDESEKIEP